MKCFFRYDDTNIWTILMTGITILFSCLAFVFRNYHILLILAIIAVSIGVLGTIMFATAGIHFNFKKGRITIVDGLDITRINMQYVHYITVEKIPAQKGNWINRLLDSPFKSLTVNPITTYVYHNGQTFYITFHRKNTGNLKIQYSVLYATRSVDRLKKQLEQLEKITQQFKQYRDNVK